MTAIQLAAVIGFVVIGIVIGAYGMLHVCRLALKHSTIESIKWITCDEGHLHGVKIEGSTPFSGKWHRSFAVADSVADDVEGIHAEEEDEDEGAVHAHAGPRPRAFDPSTDTGTPETLAWGGKTEPDTDAKEKITAEQRAIWRQMAGEMKDFLLNVAYEEIVSEREKRKHKGVNAEI